MPLQMNSASVEPDNNAVQVKPANALAQMAQASPDGAPQPAPYVPPPPSHQQTVAALRHFSAIEAELESALRDPDCGRANLRSKIIDGTTKLVANRILTPAQAVMQMSDFPDKPYDQKQWLENHMHQTMQAQAAILDHHGAGFRGQQVNSDAPDPDQHLAMMSGLMNQMAGPHG